MYGHLELALWIDLMLEASYINFHHRMVSGWLSLYATACSLLGLWSGTLVGVLCAIPFPPAVECWGGIGGGDIKFMATCGMHLGVYGGLRAVILGTASLFAFHMGYLL